MSEKPEGIVKRVFNVIVDILVVLVLIVSVTVTLLTFTSRGEGYSDVLGFTVFAVESDSMESEIMTGDLIVGRLTDMNTDYQEGDIVTFWSLDKDKNRFINTHRIVECTNYNGTMQYTTKGDNKPEEDTARITKGDIIARYTNVRIPYMGEVLSFLQTRTAFFVCVMIPMILFSLYQVFRFIVNLTEYNRQKAEDAARAAAEAASGELSEEAKRRIAEEYLREHSQITGLENETVASEDAVQTDENVEHSAKPDADVPQNTVTEQIKG